MVEEEGEALRQQFLREIRRWKDAVVDAEAKLLQDAGRHRSGIASEYARFPAGWSVGIPVPPGQRLRERARELLSPPKHSPVPAALRQLRDRGSECDRRFLRLLWEDRPMLVAAVALYTRLADFKFHPDNYRQFLVDPAFEAATKSLPLTKDWARMALRYSRRRERMERMERYLDQLESLGWGGWRVREGEVEPTGRRGGGEPMPCWMLSRDPVELDGEPPDDLSSWWTVIPPPEGRRKGKGIFPITVAAILDALGLRDEPNTREHREQAAAYLPDVFGEERRDPAPDKPLARAVHNIQT